jgi:hypothetical protein
VGRDVQARLIGSNAEVEQAPDSMVGGEVTVSTEALLHDHYLAHYKKASFYVMVLIGAAGAFVFGLGCLFERARGLHALNLRGIRG